MTQHRDVAAAIRAPPTRTCVFGQLHRLVAGRRLEFPPIIATPGGAIDAIGDAGHRWIFPYVAPAGLAPWNKARYVVSDRPSQHRAALLGFARSPRHLDPRPPGSGAEPGTANLGSESDARWCVRPRPADAGRRSPAGRTRAGTAAPCGAHALTCGNNVSEAGSRDTFCSCAL